MAREKRRRATRTWILALALATGGGIGLAWMVSVLGPARPGDRASVMFEVRPGDGLAAISARLARSGLLRSPLVFHAVARILAEPVRAGLYDLRQSMNALQVLAALHQEPSAQRLTIPEGYSIEQIAALTARLGISPATDFEQAAASPAPYLQRFPWLAILPKKASLEGFLFPDTYFLPDHKIPARLLVTMMLARFGQVVWPKLESRSKPLAPFQTVTLASIVEREARRESERPIIAGVFLSRLRRGMPLGSDPTVEYALGLHEDPAHPLTLADVRVASPYNTYRYRGLPPGPIANPGMACIEATLHPAKTPYLYFVARGDGTHEFSRTYRQQLAAERRYQP